MLKKLGLFNYRINIPVQRTIFVADSEFTNGLLEAGESALSNNSMLATPKVRCLAVFKGNAELDKYDIVDPQWTSETMYYQVELWKYDPSLFAVENSVDIVSLSMSLEGNEDERIQGELEEYMEVLKSWHCTDSE